MEINQLTEKIIGCAIEAQLKNVTEDNSVVLCDFSVKLCVIKDNFTEIHGEDTEFHGEK